MIKHLLQLTTTWQQWLAVDLVGSFHQFRTTNRFEKKNKKQNKINFNQCEFFYILEKKNKNQCDLQGFADVFLHKVYSSFQSPKRDL